MSLPFTPAEFFAVFARYNDAVWPLQVVFVVAAVAALAAIAAGRRAAPRLMLGLLAVLWLWMGAVYHGAYFRAINPAAAAFALLFVIQAALLARAARQPLRMEPRRDWRGVLGFALVVYGLIVYPVIGHFLGHRYPASPTFGLPCPTTLFTVGVLLWVRPLRPALLVVPVLWSAIGFTAALRLGVYQDTALAAAALLAIFAVVSHRRREPQPPAESIASSLRKDVVQPAAPQGGAQR